MTAPDYQTTLIPAAVIPGDAPIMPVGEQRVVGYRQHAGMLLPVYEARTEPAAYQPRDLTPSPVLDPFAQRILAAGVGGGALAAGAGWGIGEAVSGIAGISTGTVFWLVLLLAATRIPRTGRRVHETHITNHNRWFGRSTTTLH